MFFECWKTFMLPMQFFIHSLLHPSLVAVNGNEKKRARTSTAERAQLYPRVSYSFYMRDTNKYNWREREGEKYFMYETGFSCCVLFYYYYLHSLSTHTFCLLLLYCLWYCLLRDLWVFQTGRGKIVCFHFLLPVNFKKVHFVFGLEMSCRNESNLE